MLLVRLIICLFFLFVGLSYLFIPQWVLRVNAYARERVFNDAHALLSNRKIGTFFLLLAFILFALTLGRP